MNARKRASVKAISALTLSLSLLTTSVCAGSEAARESSPAEIARRAAVEGKLAYRLTTPEELKALLGPAVKETTKNDVGMEILDLRYSDVRARFGRMRRYSTPFTLLWISAGGTGVDIGQERQIVLRNEEDLYRLDSFWGFANVSLAQLDLKTIIDLWLETATQSDAGPVVNPVGFIEAVRRMQTK